MGKFTDKFLDFMKLTEEDDDYDEYEDDYEEDDEPKFSGKKALKSTKVRESSDDFDDSAFDSSKSSRTVSRSSRTRTSKVVPMRGKNGMEVCVVKPTTVEDARDITDTLVGGRAVILNLEGLHVELAQRIIDFTAGSCYAIDGNLQKVSNYIFIITPGSVEISGDFQEVLDGGIDVTSM